MMTMTDRRDPKGGVTMSTRQRIAAAVLSFSALLIAVVETAPRLRM
jgi:hypothetical protein